MPQTVGFFKMHRELFSKFSTDPKLNNNLFNVFTYLLCNAAWNDFDELKRGQVKTRTKDIQEWMPYVNYARIKKLINILVDGGYIAKSKVSHIDREGFIYEICHYDTFSGETSQKGVNPDRTPTEPRLNPDSFDKPSELLNNNHVNLTHCAPTEPRLNPDRTPEGCSYYIEERIKEEKEEKNKGSDSQSSSPPIIDGVILTKPKKERKPRVKKPTRPPVTEHHKRVFRIFDPDPRYVKKLWVDKNAIFFAVDEFLEKHGDLAKTVINEMYVEFREKDMCGKRPYSIDLVESVLNSAIEVKLNEHKEGVLEWN